MNEVIFITLNQLVGYSTLTDWLILFLAEYAGWVIIGGLLVASLNAHPHQRTYRRTLNIALAALVAWIVIGFVKLAVHTDRPFLALSDVELLIFNAKTYAFPSGHTAFFAALGVALTRYYSRIGVWCIGLSIVIGLARVSAGVHWPIDIVAGFIIGALVSWFVGVILERLYPTA